MNSEPVDNGFSPLKTAVVQLLLALIAFDFQAYTICSNFVSSQRQTGKSSPRRIVKTKQTTTY
ncbi:hypothetical protein [Spirosoma pollinicola]|uniref:Uncharacterized protein n=1 Tax=Spirosoma pollinicola TaxID=2057025 RepID=A0A2K8YXV1_9BACT|nr:hypothetical protein [Spirosoma pollinicola]AUD02466.1 hypothetical protein CWM47_11895 [Spirosoma pollinicola]